MEQHVLIIGLGLIGSSLALAIKERYPEIEITGFDQSKATEQTALQKRFIDQIAADLQESCEKADVIILAVPVKTALDYFRLLAECSLKESVIVTDVGSTKGEIMNFAEKADFCFVGGHPMAGSHKSGVNAADKDLFENAYYIFTGDNLPAIARLEQLFAGTRAKYVHLSATEHDQITGMLSHLPHIIAAGLVNQADSFNQEHPRATQLAAGGFRDITRIASSDPQMWQEILLSNRENLLQLIGSWQNQMGQLADWLENENATAIYQFFENARETRDQLPIHQNGAIPAFYDLLLDVPDEPGAIAKVTAILAEAQISIVNLKIQETREDVLGILAISFKKQKDLDAARNCIQQQTTYQCRIK